MWTEVALFDHLVGEQQDRLRNRETERLRGLQVENQLEPCRQYHRQIPRFLPLQYPAGVNTDLAIHIRKIGPVAHQSTGHRELSVLIDCRYGMLCCERCELISSSDEERIGLYDKRTNLVLGK